MGESLEREVVALWVETSTEGGRAALTSGDSPVVSDCVSGLESAIFGLLQKGGFLRSEICSRNFPAQLLNEGKVFKSPQTSKGKGED